MSSNPQDPPSSDDIQAGLFAALVMQQTNAALLYLGLAPHPQTGQTQRDLEAAQLFIDTLEMLEVKTKGNLLPEEGKLLKESLTSLRLAYVQIANRAEEAPKPAPAAAAPSP